jgi:hypothetical protein
LLIFGPKTTRTSVRLDKENLDFFKEKGVFENTSEGDDGAYSSAGYVVSCRVI